MESSENITRYYLIDYENVHQTGLNGIENLTENNIVVIFYTENAETLTFSLYEKLVQCKAEIQLCKVQCGGKNALDFQLSSYVDYIIGKNPSAEYYIVSNDRGYEYVRNFWKEKNVIINMSADIAGNAQKFLPVVVPAVQPAPAVKTETDFDKAVKPLNLSEKDKNKLCSIFYSVLNDKNVASKSVKLNQILSKHFDNKATVKFCEVINPLFPDVLSETDFNIAVEPLKLSEKDKKKLLEIYNNALKLSNFNKRSIYTNNEIGNQFGSSKQKKYYAALKPLIK